MAAASRTAMTAMISNMAGSGDLILRRTVWRQSDRGVKIFRVPRTQRSAQLLRSGALQSRGPGCLRLEETGVPGLRSSASQELRAASRPGHGCASLLRPRAGLAVADQAVQVHADVGGFG